MSTLTEQQIEALARAVRVGGARGYDFTEFPDLVPTVEAIITEQITVLMPEATETVEWGVQCDGGISGPFAERPSAHSGVLTAHGGTCSPRVVTRTRTSYAGRVSGWRLAESNPDSHEWLGSDR